MTKNETMHRIGTGPVFRKARGEWRGATAWTSAVATGLLVLAGCDLGVTNPSLIEEGDLEVPLAVPAIVNGARGAFGIGTTINGGGGVYSASAILSDELVHVGTWQPLREISEGIPGNDSPENQSHWNFTSRARWQAEDAITKASRLVDNPDSDQWVAMAAVYAGFSNRVLGEMFCDAVVDGGPLQPFTAFSERAVGHFDHAEAVAQAAGQEDLRLAAIAGRAQARLMLGQWSEAVADAGRVPTGFSFEHIHSDNSTIEHNGVHNWATRGDNGQQYSVWGTPFAEWGLEVNGARESDGDPRASYRMIFMDEETQQFGGDNRRPLWYSEKYPTRSTGIPLAKGTEMRLIEAEAALRNGQTGAAVDAMNEARSHHGLAPISAESVDEGWQHLMRERGLELWLEGRRLGDLRRWAAEPTTAQHAGFEVVRGLSPGESADADPRENVLQADPLCLRISTDEIFSNPHLANNPPR